jgi:hypothetical protein
MKYLVFLLFLHPVFATEAIQSPLRKVCAEPAGPALSEVRTVEDLRGSCTMLSQNSSVEVAGLSRDVLAVVEQIAATSPNANVRESKELRVQVGRLTDAVSAATIAQTESPREQLGSDIRSLASRFSDIDFRRANSDEYYNSIKNIIAQTSQGKRVIDCFENNPDQRIGKHEVVFIGNGPRTPGNDQAAYLDYQTDEGDPLKRVALKLNLDLRTHPLAAISMVAHEMQHACLGSTICDHINECSDTDESECTQFNEAIIADELTAHNFEAKIFTELAKSAPGIMCSYTFVDGMNGPQRLADMHATNEEAYLSGDLLSLLNGRYVRAGLWQRTTVYDPISTQPGPRPSIIERLSRLGIPAQK